MREIESKFKEQESAQSEATSLGQFKEQYKDQSKVREFCYRCHKPGSTCVCQHLRPFKTHSFDLVILQDKGERRNTVGSARLAHLTVQNSTLIMGPDFAADERVNRLLANPHFFPVVLFPGLHATRLTPALAPAYLAQIPQNKRLLVFVIDGTWGSAKKMLRLSPNVLGLPQISFLPTYESQYQFRKQPKAHCLSTLEAVHTLVGLFDRSPAQPEQALLDVFKVMVEQQVGFTSNRRLREHS